MNARITPVGVGWACILWMVAGCGGGGSPMTDSPGTGTHTLSVQASVSADNTQNDGSGISANFQTTLNVTVADSGGGPVTGATVRMNTSLGLFTLTESTFTPGNYSYSYTGYSTYHTLSVVSGSDNVEGATLIGPDLHSITFPVQGGTYGVGQSMTTNWKKSTNAEQVHISTKLCLSGVFGMPDALDTGSYVLKGNICFPFADNNQRVRIERMNQSTIGGGVAGSLFQATVTNPVRPVVIQ